MSSPPAKPPKPKNVKLIRAEHAYVAEEEDELSFDEGDLLYILDSSKFYLEINLLKPPRWSRFDHRLVTCRPRV